MKRYVRTRENLVYENRFIQLFDDDVTTPEEERGSYIRLRYHGNPPGVVIVPRCGEGRYLLLNLIRYAANAASLEFPRGTANQGEGAEQAARRELKEETNVAASSCRFLGYLRPDTSIVETEVHVFVADVPEAELRNISVDEGGEAIEGYELMTLEELRAGVRSGAIRCGFTIGTLGLMAANDLF